MTKEEATSFYDDSYRQTYLRLLVVVSHFYQRCDGLNKEKQFWEAQRLTLRDCPGRSLKRAFVSIVSGLEDLRDTQEILDTVLARTTEAHAELKRLTIDKELLGLMSPVEREALDAKVQFLKGAALLE